MEFVWRWSNHPSAVLRAQLGFKALEPSDLPRLKLKLPDIPAQHLLLASFSCLDGGQSTSQFHLRFAGGQAQTLRVGGDAASAATQDQRAFSTHQDVTAPLDYFEVHQRIQQAELHLHCDDLEPGRPFWLSVCVRPLRIEPGTGSLMSKESHPAPVLTQMSAAPEIARRICSPTSLAMALMDLGAPAELGSVCTDCYDAPSGLYGVWPLAIRAAAQRGVLGAVEALTHVDALVPLLQLGVRAITSMRWQHAELEGSAIPASAGHLMLVRAIEEQWVWVNDPAADTADTVPRRYRREQWARTWLRERGVCYLLLPQCNRNDMF